MTLTESIRKRIQQAREMREKASPGVWKRYDGHPKDCGHAIDAFTKEDECSVFYAEGRCQLADAEFITFAANEFHRFLGDLEKAIEALVLTGCGYGDVGDDCLSHMAKKKCKRCQTLAQIAGEE